MICLKFQFCVTKEEAHDYIVNTVAEVHALVASSHGPVHLSAVTMPNGRFCPTLNVMNPE
jgi:hypothetical protein